MIEEIYEDVCIHHEPYLGWCVVGDTYGILYGAFDTIEEAKASVGGTKRSNVHRSQFEE